MVVCEYINVCINDRIKKCGFFVVNIIFKIICGRIGVLLWKGMVDRLINEAQASRPQSD